MGIAERREREREQLKTKIVEAARDILSEQGLEALSMRSIAERIEYSPATIYLYFRDKDELIREVVQAGFGRLAEVLRSELAAQGAGANAAEQYRACGRAYARFALENTAYFRVMFELPAAAQMECPEPVGEDAGEAGDGGTVDIVRILRRAADDGLLAIADPQEAALIGWGLIHGLVSLFLSGNLRSKVQTAEQFQQLIEAAMSTMYEGWKVDGTAGGSAVETERSERS